MLMYVHVIIRSYGSEARTQVGWMVSWGPERVFKEVNRFLSGLPALSDSVTITCTKGGLPVLRMHTLSSPAPVLLWVTAATSAHHWDQKLSICGALIESSLMTTPGRCTALPVPAVIILK